MNVIVGYFTSVSGSQSVGWAPRMLQIYRGGGSAKYFIFAD